MSIKSIAVTALICAATMAVVYRVAPVRKVVVGA